MITAAMISTRRIPLLELKGISPHDGSRIAKKVELQSQIEDAENILEMNLIMTPLLKQSSSYDQEVFPSVSKK
ncbi:hypothetical protein PIB30_067021 [Stylosanthes scabra]|uniref:Uncharacterized protein n=1 Tax=Stylosanthes scabra TaxID=79078 RepID=A0ABU6YK13_9FABA|nr:hypothetical protein [Stylosanthes scabra]